MLDERELIAQYENDDTFDPFHYVPPGPVSQAFILDDRLSPFIMGPVGGGKTVSCAFKRVRAVTRQPVCRDGWIRDRWIVLRDTFRDAEKTVLASWRQWFPKGYPGSTWTGGNDRPVTHTLRFRLLDGTKVELITEFIGLNGESVEKKMPGWEISGVWMNEANVMDEGALRYLEQRTGRYPPPKDLADPDAKRFRQVIGDFNAPDVDNWTYKAFIENGGGDRFLHQQPSGLSPDAENIENLDPDYYESMVRNNEPWFVKRMVHNEFGYSREGMPVFEDFNQHLHLSDAVKVDPDLELLIGMDAGLHPAAIFGQMPASGQIRITDELVPGHGFGANRFAELVLELIARKYPQVRSIRAWCDPAAQYGADREGGELAWIETVSQKLGIAVQVPANGSNEIGLRLDAVKGDLRRLIDGRTPGIVVSRSRCPILVRGFSSGYRYRKMKDGRFEPVPEKNDYSHPHDALQYLVLGARGRQAVTRAGGGWSAGRTDGSAAPKSWASGRRDFDVHRL